MGFFHQEKFRAKSYKWKLTRKNSAVFFPRGIFILSFIDWIFLKKASQKVMLARVSHYMNMDKRRTIMKTVIIAQFCLHSTLIN